MGQESRFSVWVRLPARPSPAEPGPRLPPLPAASDPTVSRERAKLPPARASWLRSLREPGTRSVPFGNSSRASRHTHKAGCRTA